MLLFYFSLIDTQENKDKFEQLYHQYCRLMHYVANNILHDEFLAEDAVHSAFLKIIPNLNKLEDISSHKTKGFVVIVVENVAKNMYMKRKKNNTVSFEDVEYEIAENTADLEQLVEKLSLESIVEKMSQLSKQDSDVLLLRYVDDLTNKEIAKLLDLKDAIVRKRLERARQRLAILLMKDGDLQ